MSPNREKKQASRKAKGLLRWVAGASRNFHLHFCLPISVGSMVEIDSEFVAVHSFLYLVLPVMDQRSRADN